MSDLGPRDTSYRHIRRSEALTILCLFILLPFPFVLKFSVCKNLSDCIWSVFIIIKYGVDASNFHIDLIVYCVVMHESPDIFSDIINVYLVLLLSVYNPPFYD